MADSMVTKKAMATALKELMSEEPFREISVGDICDRCQMNRKSFYYHFRDKYALIDWIFDTEFGETVQQTQTMWDIFEALCCYLYDNRRFYRKALKIEGQDAFSARLREWCRYGIEVRLQTATSQTNLSAFQLDFCADAFLCAVKRWLSDRVCMSPRQFAEQLRVCIQIAAAQICDAGF